MKRATYTLTSRDHDILLDIYKYRFLTIQQMQRLHFPSLQTTYRRVRVLKQHGCIATLHVAHIDEAILTLAPGGLRTVAEALGVERTELKWSSGTAKPRDHYFMRHFLAINGFRIALSHACVNSQVQLLGFIPDYYGEKARAGGVAKYIRDVICDVTTDRESISHTPDGVFALQKDGRVALFFLEIDRGTEIVSDPDKGVLKSLRFYANYLLDGKYQRYAEEFGVPEFKGFRSLYVTTSQARLTNIRQAAAKLNVPPKAKRFQWLTIADNIEEHKLFTPIWFSCDLEDPENYQIG